MHRRRILLYGILAVCIVATIVGVTLNGQRMSANASAAAAMGTDDTAKHPQIFDFEATRTGNTSVVFSGRYEVWNDIDKQYQPGSNLIAVDIQDGGDWSMLGAYSTDGTGHFSGSERIGGAYPLRARATDVANDDLATSSSVMLAFQSRSKVEWASLEAQKSGDAYTISGNIYGIWARDPDSNNVDYLGRYPNSVAIQAEVDGVWTTIKRVGTDSDSDFTATVTNPPSTTFRVKVAKNLFYYGSKKTVKVTKGF